MARPDPLCRQPRRRAGRVDPEPVAACPRRPARSADPAACRYVSPDRQGMAVPDRCRGRCRPVHLCAGVASSDAAAPRLGTPHEPCGALFGGCRNPARVVPHRSRRVARAGVARAARFRGPGQHAGRRGHIRLPCAGPERRPLAARRNLGLWKAQPVCAVDGLDPWTTAALARRSQIGWRFGDWLERAGVKPHRWRQRTGLSAFDPV